MARPSNSPARPEAGPPAIEAEGIKQLLERSADRLAAVLPSHIAPAKMIQIVSTMAFKTPDLAKCSRASILAAVIEAAELGLDLSPHLGEAWILPVFNKRTNQKEAQLRLGYQGMRHLSMNSGLVTTLQSRVVREHDVFEFEYRPELHFVHIPRLTGEITLAYATAILKGSSERLVEVMTREEIEAIRQRSQSPNSGPWVSDWGEMARKTVLRRLWKSLPRSTQMEKAIEVDNREFADFYAAQQAAPALPRASRTEALRRQLAGPEEESQEPEILAEEVSQEQGREPGEEG